jgi:uncharacterized membrane protein
MTLPVFLIMLGGHFPAVFDHPHSWAIITAIALSAGLIKHFHNLIQKKQPGIVFLLAAMAVFGGAVFAAIWPAGNNMTCHNKVSDEEAYQIVATHCLMCHSTSPTHPGWRAPPNGVVFDTVDQMLRRKDRILDRAVTARTMPLANQTGMKPDERHALGCWITAAADGR